MRAGIIWSIFKKEVLDLIRDKRSIIGVILIPLIAMPLLMGGVSVFMASRMKKVTQETVNIGYLTAEEKAHMNAIFTEVDINWVLIKREDIEQFLKDKKLHFVAEFSTENLSEVYTFHYDKANTSSDLKFRKLRNALGDYENVLIKEILVEHGVPDNIWDTVMVKIENIASEEKMKSMFLAMILPYMLILITMSGASYPATDLSVGEKERGTLETLLAASILRKEIVIGKYLTTVLVALVSSASSLISISLTFRLLPSSSQFAAHISFQTMITAFFAILPVAMIFSALVFAIASFAKSMKEAQGYIGPLTMAVIFPAMVSIFPGFEADMSTVFIPIVNISLLLKNIILGDVRGYYLIITLLESFLLAGFFIIMAFRLFDRESVIFKGE